MTEQRFTHTKTDSSREAQAFVSKNKGRLGEVLPIHITQEIIDNSVPDTMMYTPISIAIGTAVGKEVAVIPATRSIEPAAGPPWQWSRSYQMGDNLLTWLKAYHAGKEVRPIWIVLSGVTDYGWIVDTDAESLHNLED